MVRPVLAGALGALVVASTGCAPRPDDPRHVLLVVIDTLRADHLSGYGHALPSSPTIDRLAESGVVFTNAISQSSWTAPSMISLLTSRYLSGYHLQVPPGIPTIAEIFREEGYATGAFVENPLISPENGYRGFDEFRARPPLDQQVVAWIEERAGENVFTYVHIVDPHDPYEPPEEMRFDVPAPLRPGRLGVYARAAREHSIAEPERSAREIRDAIGAYDGEVRKADARVLRYLRALEASHQREGSVVVVASDHGEGLWTRPLFGPLVRKALARSEAADLQDVFKGGHGNQLYREQVHVPLVIRARGLPAGSSIDALVENVDIAPTLLELVGLPPRAELVGRSLVPLTRTGEGRAGAFSQTRYGWMWRAADGRKLIWPTELGRSEMELVPELYDLVEDPEERDNVADRRPGEVAELLTELEAVRADALASDASATETAQEANAAALEALGYLDDGGPLDDPDRD